VEPPPEPVGVEALQELDESFVLLPEQHLSWDAHVVKKDLVVIDPAGHVADRTDLHAPRLVVDDEHAEAVAAPRITPGARQHETVRRDAGVARPDLVSANEVLVSVAPGLGRQSEQVRTGARFAEALPERRLAARDARQQLPAKSLGAIADDRVGGLIASG